MFSGVVGRKKKGMAEKWGFVPLYILFCATRDRLLKMRNYIRTETNKALEGLTSLTPPNTTQWSLPTIRQHCGQSKIQAGS